MKNKPVIHCITNNVTVNDCANILLAAGAAPVMAHHPLETAEVTAAADALVLNLGATDHIEAMKLSLRAAADRGIPIVIDPVGTGGIAFRRKLFWELIGIAGPTCVRGNLSEIRGLLMDRVTTRGVDASDEDETSTGAESRDEIVKTLAGRLNCIVVASGKEDAVSDGKKICHIEGGHELMTRVTGTGCMSSVLIGAYLAAFKGKETPMEATEKACRLMAEAGAAAGRKAEETGGGTMTFRDLLIDEISLGSGISEESDKSTS